MIAFKQRGFVNFVNLKKLNRLSHMYCKDAREQTHEVCYYSVGILKLLCTSHLSLYLIFGACILLCHFFRHSSIFLDEILITPIYYYLTLLIIDIVFIFVCKSSCLISKS